MSDMQVSSIRRCAIYARKSTQHRLDHEVNSIETRRDILDRLIRATDQFAREPTR